MSLDLHYNRDQGLPVSSARWVRGHHLGAKNTCPVPGASAFCLPAKTSVTWEEEEREHERSEAQRGSCLVDPGEQSLRLPVQLGLVLQESHPLSGGSRKPMLGCHGVEDHRPVLLVSCGPSPVSVIPVIQEGATETVGPLPVANETMGRHLCL